MNFQVNPDDLVFGGWDISSMNLADAMTRAKVLDIDLQKQLRPYMESIVPLPGIYDPDFIAANQGSRANNVIKGTKKEQMEQIIKDIRYYRCAYNLYNCMYFPALRRKKEYTEFGARAHMIEYI